MSPFELVLKLFGQLVVILAACRLVAIVGRRLGQTPVVSEMIAGVLLGPSLFGLLAPAWQEWLFPQRLAIEVAGAATTIVHPSMTILYAISQIGLVLYMFTVGLEFQAERIGRRAKSAALVSATGIVVPFALGAGVALAVRGRGDLFAPNVGAGAAALFLGASMAITAFPMLARIIQEKGIAGTRLGTVTLAAGSLDDAVAWCLLAAVLAVIRGSPAIAWLAFGGGLLYVLGMIGLVRPLLRVFERRTRRDGGITPATMVEGLLVVMLAAWLTDTIGIYAVFGAFVAGAVMPRGRFSEELLVRVEPLTSAILVPVFFAYAGLNTRLSLVHTPRLWLLTAGIVILAIAGKGIACMLAARAAGEGWRESAAIGTLMNARGLMELVILNIGLQQGVITPTLFTIMVLMTAVTNLMTSPLYDWVYGRHAAPRAFTRPRAAAVSD